MKPVKIFVEGKLSRDKKEAHSTDSPFLRDCVKKWFGKEHSLFEHFHYIGGASEIWDMAPDIRRVEEKYQILVIIDANGNPEKRKKEIEEFQAQENLNFPFFLFPDNRHAGEIETLIEQTASNKKMLNCFETYEKCIGRKLDIKAKIFAYITAVTGSEEAAKDKNRNFLNEHFNLDDGCLNPLKEFLGQYIKP